MIWSGSGCSGLPPPARPTLASRRVPVRGPGEWFGRADRLGAGITVGELHLRPAALLQAMLVLAATLIALKAKFDAK